MSYIVVKPFKTVTRRFASGDAVTAADIDGSLNLEGWIERGFVSEASSSARASDSGLSPRAVTTETNPE